MFVCFYFSGLVERNTHIHEGFRAKTHTHTHTKNHRHGDCSHSHVISVEAHRRGRVIAKRKRIVTAVGRPVESQWCQGVCGEQEGEREGVHGAPHALLLSRGRPRQGLLRTRTTGVIGCNCDRRVCVLEVPGAETHRKLGSTSLPLARAGRAAGSDGRQGGRRTCSSSCRRCLRLRRQFLIKTFTSQRLRRYRQHGQNARSGARSISIAERATLGTRSRTRSRDVSLVDGVGRKALPAQPNRHIMEVSKLSAHSQTIRPRVAWGPRAGASRNLSCHSHPLFHNLHILSHPLKTAIIGRSMAGALSELSWHFFFKKKRSFFFKKLARVSLPNRRKRFRRLMVPRMVGALPVLCR